MSAALLALLVAGGCSVWVYTKLQNRTGYSNNKSAIQGSAVVFIVGFIVVLTIARMVLR